MRFTRHAARRWEQRFPNLDKEHQFAKAKHRLGKKMRSKVKASCPANAQFCSKSFRGRYLRMTREGIVFVIAPPEVVITVLDFRGQ